MKNDIIYALINKARKDFLSFKDANSNVIVEMENTINAKGDTKSLLSNPGLHRGTSGRYYIQLPAPESKTKERRNYNSDFADKLKEAIHSKGLSVSQYKQVLGREENFRAERAA